MVTERYLLYAFIMGMIIGLLVKTKKPVTYEITEFNGIKK